MAKRTLFEEFPELIAEWDYDKNGMEGTFPSDITRGSHKTVWWKCSKGHLWKAPVYDRTAGRGCPYCSGRKVLIGYNDLASKAPWLSGEWDYEKNNGISPETVTCGCNRKVWWKCREGHNWQVAVCARYGGSGCPYCSGQKVWVGYNDFASRYPALVAEWDYDKNGEALPKDFTSGSKKKVWWRCKLGHSWKAVIYSRNGGRRNCPYCSGKRVLAGYNDLATTNPALAEEWDYERNNEKLPEHFTGYSKKKAWWRCDKGHSWLSTIHNRTLGNGCPYCSGRNAIAGYNDFFTLRPDLAGEWDYDKNQKIHLDQLTVNAHDKVWWKCNKGHSWRATVYSTTNGSGCPYCAGKVAVKTRFIT